MLILNFQVLYSQTLCDNYCLNFEDTTCIRHLIIDTTVFPQNLWQIGWPQKLLFDNAASPSNAIVTDTIHPYPINNYSVYIIKNIASMGDIYGFKMFSGNYNIQTDSSHDYGRIEFSPDKGTTWVDILKDTTYKAFVWFSEKPVLTGISHKWKYFEVLLADIGSVFNVHLGDTILFRFSFTSDSIFDNLGGLMYDNLCFQNFIEGISEIRFKPIKSKIYPNPSTNNIFTIEFENPSSEPYQLSVYDIHSKLVYTKDDISGTKIFIDFQTFNPGIYIYKLTNMKAPKRCWGKFISSK